MLGDEEVAVSGRKTEFQEGPPNPEVLDFVAFGLEG